MNRSNVGNIVTNGVQIMSVAGHTASRVLGSVDKTLNNLTKQEQKDYYGMKADKIREDIKHHQNVTDDAFRRLSDEEQSEYKQMKADKMRDEISAYKEKDSNESVDDIMEDVVPTNSPQAEELSRKISGDIEYIKRWVGRDKKTGRFVSLPQEEKGGNK